MSRPTPRSFETPCGEGNHRLEALGRGRPMVVVAHGAFGSGSHWIKPIRVLKDRYELWAVDLPGLGDSDMPPHPHTPESCGNAMALGIRRSFRASAVAHVVAFSFGAHVSTLRSVAAPGLGRRFHDHGVRRARASRRGPASIFRVSAPA